MIFSFGVSISGQWHEVSLGYVQCNKKGSRMAPLEVFTDCRLFDYQLLCVYFVAAYDADVIYAACIVACVEFVGFNACLNIVRQDYSAL